MQVRLSASDLACRRGDRVLFSGLNIDLSAGQALQIEGANGIGKTSLLRILAGLLRPYSGTVDNHGEIGLLDERPGLDPELTVRKALGFWERVDGCNDPRGAILAMGLEPLLDVPVRFLSTGQRKRAALASLLNRDVKIWLLDEPLSGLDARAIQQVTALIALHIGGGGLAVIASHQPVELQALETLQLADYVPHHEIEDEPA